MVTGQRMSVDETRAIVERLDKSKHTDVELMAPDVVFRVMATGQEFRTPQGVLGMFDYFYRGVFEAHSETKNLVAGEGIGVLEAVFVGRHVGEFAGVPGTGKEVRVPLAVIYDLRDGKIVEGRIYFEIPAFLAQVGAAG